MPGLCQLPVPAEISLMSEFRFLAPLGMTYTFSDGLQPSTSYSQRPNSRPICLTPAIPLKSNP